MTTPPKPTLLAFHGSGSNATVHSVQLARLSRLLKPHFIIESLEAPFPSAAGPGILPFFEGCGPYKRWIPASEKLSLSAMKSGQASSVLPPAVEDLVRAKVEEVREKGGRVAGLIGFSQGTRVVAGLLKGAEIAAQLKALGGGSGNDELEWLNFPMALSVCGSYPPPTIPASATKALEASSLSAKEQKALVDGKIAIPTYHVQGKGDEWSWAGKLLMEACYEFGEGKSKLLEADMGHHYPSKAEETEMVKDWVLAVWEKAKEG